MAEETFRDESGEAGNLNEPTDLARSASDHHDGDYSGLGPRMAWRTASVLFAVTTAGLLVQLTTDLFNGGVARTSILLALAALAGALSFAWWRISTLDISRHWLHAGVVVSYLMLAAVLSQTPALESHLGVAYLPPLIFAALFLPSRSLPYYIALSIAFIAYSTISHAGERFGVVPGVMTVAALVTTTCLTLYVRIQLDRIGRQAVFLSGRDALTGLANLRTLYERVENLMRRAKREHDGLAVIMLDLDGFKRVNDQHSHSVGDQTLRAVARTMADTVRRSELVARRGGDEFAIVSEAHDPEEIETLIERISEAVATTREALLPDMPAGVTAGYSVYQEGDSVGQLLSRADNELHSAKAAAKIERWSWRARRLGQDFEHGHES